MIILGQITNLIDGQALLQWIIMAAIVGYFLYKAYPEFKSRFTANTKKEVEEKYKDENLEKRVDMLEKTIKDIDLKLSSDYIRLEAMEEKLERTSAVGRITLEESEVIMRALLACLDGIMQLGADGSTHVASKEITDYLTKRAHCVDNL